MAGASEALSVGCYLAEKRSETKEKPISFLGGRGCYTSRVMEERRLEEEKARIEAAYREVLKNSVAFEKRIRDRWREKNREKNARIAELEARVAELEQELKNASR